MMLRLSHRHRWPGKSSIAFLALALLIAGLIPAASRAAAQAIPTRVYIAQSGHHLEGAFLSFWRNNGKAVYLGNPITEELTEQGLAVQYFEKARLELHGDTMLLGNLGTEALLAQGIDPSLIRQPAKQRRLLRGDEVDLPTIRPFDRLPFALFPTNPDDHRFFPESGHTLNSSFKLAWEKTGGLEQYGLPLSEEFPEVSPIDGQIYITQYFERARFEYHPETSNNYSVVLTPLGSAAAQARGLNVAPIAQEADSPKYDESLFNPTPTVAVASKPPITYAGKWIDVNLSRQYLTAYNGDEVVLGVYMSSGRSEHSTPIGSYRIFSKLVSDDMRGPDPDLPGGQYFQPDVPYVMYFAGGGYAIHGVYWHSNFGVPMSHGCVGLPVGVASTLYNWAPIGTLIVIHY